LADGGADTNDAPPNPDSAGFDSTFGTDGVTELPPEGINSPGSSVPAYPRVTALALQGDGKILAGLGSDLYRLNGSISGNTFRSCK